MIIQIDMPELKEMISLFRRCSNNMKQIAKKTNQTWRLYREDMGDILQNQEHLWQAANAILRKLSAL